MKIHLPAVIAAATALSLSAAGRTLTPAEALTRAEHELSVGHSQSPVVSRAADMQLSYTQTAADGSAQAYVFTSVTGGKFICAAAEADSPRAVLGYSDGEGTDTTRGDVPPSMKWWLSTYSGRAGTDRDSTLTPIEPLLTTVWGQGNPFNLYTPLISNAHAPTGCVATALAQCMKYECWPPKGKGTSSYVWSGNGEKLTLAQDFDTISFDWDLMAPNYAVSTTEAQRREVAKLMYALGVSFHMDYNLAGSGSNYMTAASALIEHFDYAESVCYYERDYFGQQEWRDKIYSELAKGRPVPYSGLSSTEGHAFVVDGYRADGYFHVNWGWDGGYNGWFLLSQLNAKPEQEGKISDGYNMGQAILTGLTRSSKSEPIAIELRVSGDFTTGAQRYARSSAGNVLFKCENGIFSMAYATAVVTLGVKITDTAGKESYAAASTPHTFKHFSATQNYEVPVSEFPAHGSFDVSPAFRDSAGVWHDILIDMSKERSVSLRATPSTLVFGLSAEQPMLTVEDIHAVTTIHIGLDSKVTATISNSGAEYFDEVWPVLLKDNELIAHGVGMDVDVPEGETQNFEWVGVFQALANKMFEPGTYTLSLAESADGVYKVIGGATEVEVHAASQAPLLFTAGAVSIDGVAGENSTATTPIEVSGSTVPMSFSLSVAQGYFGQTVWARVFPLGSSISVLTSRGQFVGLDEGNSSDVGADIDISTLEKGKVYEVYPWASTSGRLCDTPTYMALTSVTALEGIDSDDAEAESAMYTIDGLRVTTEHPAPGIYIVVRGGKSRKVLITGR